MNEKKYDSDYVVFVDESFKEWFSMEKKDADFCHAGIAIPTVKLEDLMCFVLALDKYILKNLSFKVQNQQEIKYELIRKLEERFRSEVASKIALFFQKNKCYIFGFYAGYDPLLCNMLRDKYFATYGGDIEDFAINIDLEKDELRKELLLKDERIKEERYDIKILRKTYESLIHFMLHFFAGENKTFIIQYDPRQKKEDKILNDIVTKSIESACDFFSIRKNPYLGFDNSLRSEVSNGLTLADFIAGDIRAFFREHSEILEACSKLEVLSAKANPRMCGLFSNGLPLPFYRKQIPDTVLKSTLNDTQFLFHYIYKYLANNKIACFAKYGEARLIDFKDQAFFDMAD